MLGEERVSKEGVLAHMAGLWVMVDASYNLSKSDMLRLIDIVIDSISAMEAADETRIPEQSDRPGCEEE